MQCFYNKLMLKRFYTDQIIPVGGNYRYQKYKHGPYNHNVVLYDVRFFSSFAKYPTHLHCICMCSDLSKCISNSMQNCTLYNTRESVASPKKSRKLVSGSLLFFDKTTSSPLVKYIGIVCIGYRISITCVFILQTLKIS